MRRLPFLVLALSLSACGPAGAPTEVPSAAASAAPALANGEASAVTAADATAVADLEKHATQILNAFGNRAPHLSYDGRTLVFSSNRDGAWQIYTADALAPRSEVHRLVTRPEAVTPVAVMPHAGGPDDVLFVSQPNTALFAVALDGSDLRELTPGPALNRGTPLPIAARAGSFVYTARDTTHVETQLHELGSKAGLQPRVLYTDPHECRLVDLTSDGTRALLVRTKAAGEQELASIDLVRGEARTLYAPGGSGLVHTARFIEGGKRVLVATDAATESNLVLLLDARTAQEAWRYADDVRTGSVRDISTSRDDKTAAILVRAGGRDLVRFLDLGAKTGAKKTSTKTKLRDAVLPPGDGALGAFTPDGSRVMLRWALPDEPGTLYNVPVATGQPSALRAETRPVLAKLPPLTAVNLEIPAFDGARIPLNLYVPKGGAEKKPILVMVHGGPADVSTIGYNPLIRFYTAFGFSVVEPNLRGSTGFGQAYERADDGPKRLDSLRDLQSVGEWVKTQPWADPARLALWGGSYGGYVVLMGLTRQPALWRVGVDFAGPSSWRSFFASLSPAAREEFSRELGSPEKDGAFLDSISPLSAADAIRAPLFLFQGQNDTRVPRAESDRIVTSLRSRQVPVEYFVAPDEGHVVQRRETQATLLARSTLFLRKHMEMP